MSLESATHLTKSKNVSRATPRTKPTVESPAELSATLSTEPMADSRSPELETIQILGHLLDDLERLRIANGNRIGALEREHGDALPHLVVIQNQLEQIEHVAELELKRAWRKHPLAAWAKPILGAGEVLTARLIACIGDPATRPNVAKLWAYCGHGDPARAGQIPKNASQEELFKRGNPEAKKRVYLLAAQFRRTPGSEYRDVYDQARERYRDRVHANKCPRCGPAGHPAQPGSPWSPAHQDAAALRFVGKQFLKALWLAVHVSHDTHGCAGGRPE